MNERIFIIEIWPDSNNDTVKEEKLVKGLFNLLSEVRELIKEQKGFCVWKLGECLGDFS